jgi:hypothetical protein
MKYTQGEYCDMLSNPGTLNNRAGTAAREHVPRYPVDVIQTDPDANIFRRLEQLLRVRVHQGNWQQQRNCNFRELLYA